VPQSIPAGLKQEQILKALADLDAGIDHPFCQPTGYELVQVATFTTASRTRRRACTRLRDSLRERSLDGTCRRSDPVCRFQKNHEGARSCGYAKK
jgi:hypothetical protein